MQIFIAILVINVLYTIRKIKINTYIRAFFQVGLHFFYKYHQLSTSKNIDLYPVRADINRHFWAFLSCIKQHAFLYLDQSRKLP